MNQGSKQGEAASVTEAWRHELKVQGYEPPEITTRSCLKFRLLSRTWRRILWHTGLRRSDPVRVLEFGCGGGIQLVPLYVNGWSCTGVDCSEEVLERAARYVRVVNNSSCRPKGDIKFVRTDFIGYKPDRSEFDLTVQFGVLEHFLDDAERLQYVRKMFEVTRPGGFIVSAVPNGCHAVRAKERRDGLGGYKIPEIDYSDGLIEKEMRACGAIEVKVLPHNLFGYLRIMNLGGVRRFAAGLIYYLFQLPIFQFLPRRFLRRHAYGWVAVARKA